MSADSPASVHGRVCGKPVSPSAENSSAAITAGNQSSRLPLGRHIAPHSQGLVEDATAVLRQSAATPTQYGLACVIPVVKKTVLPDETRIALIKVVQAWGSDTPKDLHWLLTQLKTLRPQNSFGWTVVALLVLSIAVAGYAALLATPALLRLLSAVVLAAVEACLAIRVSMLPYAPLFMSLSLSMGAVLIISFLGSITHALLKPTEELVADLARLSQQQAGWAGPGNITGDALPASEGRCDTANAEIWEPVTSPTENQAVCSSSTTQTRSCLPRVCSPKHSTAGAKEASCCKCLSGFTA